MRPWGVKKVKQRKGYHQRRNENTNEKLNNNKGNVPSRQGAPVGTDGLLLGLVPLVGGVRDSADIRRGHTPESMDAQY